MPELLHRSFLLTCLLAAGAVWPAEGPPRTFTNDSGMQFILLPAGEFDMGRLRVKISKPFYLGKYEVTQDEWVKTMFLNPSYFNEARHPDDWRRHPVEQVSWDDARKFADRLSARDKKYRYRLPTEAEWEYAARAGGVSETANGWYVVNSKDTSHPVGELPPNPWGFHDMAGNVWEWCQDWHTSRLPVKGPVIDPAGPAKGSYRVVRGGAWCLPATSLQPTRRENYEPEHRDACGGLRLAAEPVGP